MFSGGDSSEGINSLNRLGTYGFVNQVAVSNAMAAGQNIDWAQLAQQWIQMRDNSEIATKSNSEASEKKVIDSSCNNLKFEEKGEADMDMDDEEQSNDKATQRTHDLQQNSVLHDNLSQSWIFGENNSQIASRSGSNNPWNSWQSREIITQTLPTQNLFNNQPVNSTAHIPSLLKINIPNPNELRVVPNVSNQSDNTYVMDAAKRKGLPAWIREGLEKMEREKQKQLEKEQQTKDVNSLDEDDISNKKSFLQSSNSVHGISDAVLDDDSTDNEEATTLRRNAQKDVSLKTSKEEDDTYSSVGDKTYEQKLSELMIVVRHSLTELLLETTNEEISKVADETIKRFKSKASSAQVIRKSALSSLTGKLGLAEYGDSSSEDDSENDDSNSSKKPLGQSESDNDSEEELRNIIRIKRRAFIKTSEDIEDRVIASAAQEEEKLKYFLRKEEEEKEYNRSKKERSSVKDSSTSGHSGHNFTGYEKDFGEITETKIQHLNGKRQKERSSRKERITRFSDNKDKYVAIPNATTFLTNLNSGSNFVSGHNTSTLANNSQRQNIPDINGLLPNYASTGVTNALSAADAALEKALKGKPSTHSENQSRRYERDRFYNQSKKKRLSESKNSRSRSKSSNSSSTSSSSSSSSSDTATSSSRSSRSKYKYRSAKKHKSHTSVERKYEKSNKDRRDERKSSSRLCKKRDHESTSSRNLRNASSDSEDDYRRRHRNDSSYHRKSSRTRSYTSSRYDREREHSRSQSRSSYSSNNRRQ